MKQGINIWNTSIDDFVDSAKKATNAIEKINFDKLTEKINTLAKTARDIESGA
jgi:diacylglycerol kinase